MEKGRDDRHLASGLPYDMTTTVTTEDGQVCVFVAVDHCTSECIGIHASLSGNRFEALESIRQGVRERFGGFDEGIAAGLAVRHDHGSAYMSDDFQRELVFLGMTSSPSFVREPEGMASRNASFAPWKRTSSGCGRSRPSPSWSRRSGSFACCTMSDG